MWPFERMRGTVAPSSNTRRTLRRRRGDKRPNRLAKKSLDHLSSPLHLPSRPRPESSHPARLHFSLAGVRGARKPYNSLIWQDILYFVMQSGKSLVRFRTEGRRSAALALSSYTKSNAKAPQEGWVRCPRGEERHPYPCRICAM